MLTLAVLLTSTAGCDWIDKAKKAKAAAESLTEAAEEMSKAAEAGDAAAAEAKRNLDPNLDPEQAKQQVEAARAEAALAALGKHAEGEGAVVNWRQLAPFVPDALGDFSASKDLDGKTQTMGAVTVSNVKRSYQAGDRRATIEVTDTHFSNLLRAPFRMAALVKEDSSSGYKMGKEVAGHTALVEWSKPQRRSQASLLVGERYLVAVKIQKTDTPDDAEKLAAALDLAALARLVPTE